MRAFLLIVSVFFLLGYSSVPDKGEWVIDSSSRLIIHGVTNVNTFTCSITCYNNADTLEYVEDLKNCELVFKKNKMVIPVNEFDCGSKMITRDFMETLKADTHKNLEVRFISIEKLADHPEVTGTVEIALAGVTKKYQIRYQLNRSQHKVHLTGKQNVCFSDFDLKAPQKMMGLIQVAENLNVEFQIVFRPV